VIKLDRIGSLLAVVVCARSHDRVEVGVRKPVLLDAREGPEEGGRVGDVGGPRLASTTGEDAADASEAVSDDGARRGRRRHPTCCRRGG
jgi:hypothetical protein